MTTSRPIEIENLDRRFKDKQALSEISLTVPAGSVFGLVGENGAGKTTLINHMLGFLKAQTGSVKVFGFDPVINPPEVLSRIGYLSEDRMLPDWMRISQYAGYLRNFYPRWDQSLEKELMETFELNPKQRIKSLSRGQRARAGLLCALSHRPELLILDEPSSGLDVIVRRDILAAIIRNVVSDGRTVVFSSHLLEEVERVSDHLAFLNSGRIVLQGPLEEVLSAYGALSLRFSESISGPPDIPGVVHWLGADRDWTAICNGEIDRVRQHVSEHKIEVTADRPASLDEVFVATARPMDSASGEER